MEDLKLRYCYNQHRLPTHTLTRMPFYPNHNGLLLPGRYADVSLKQEEISDAIAIPSEAIVPEMGKNKVFVYRSGKAYPVDVEIGIRTEAEIQIVKGLSAGDTLFTSGTFQLFTVPECLSPLMTQTNTAAMNISELSIRRPVLATVLTIIILLFGMIGYTTWGYVDLRGST